MAKQILGKVVPIAKGEYNSSTQYEILDIVTHNGSSYIAKTNVKGQTPTNTTYWQLLAKVGDKPVYGVDYLTEQEMDAIVQDIINDSTNTFNQNVTTKTNEFNTNATSKTNAFNQNAENKTTTFNNNASAKTSTFNTNASDKTTDFNNNATAKTTAFNTNAQNKTNDFNTNATSSTDDFDRNATAKTEAYNSNAGDKLSAYNSNAESKLSSYNTNASSKVSAYDENHATKMGAYNTNDTTKTTAYNNNASDKTAAFNENYQEKLDDFNSHVEDYDKRITANSNRIQHIETDLFDSGNATGDYITLNDSTLAEFIDIKEDGVCEQTTTSIADGDEYDSPSPEHPQPITVLEGSHNIVVTGKNLISNSFDNATINGITLIKNNDGSLTLNGTSTKHTNFNIDNINMPVTVGETYTLSQTGLIAGNIGFKDLEGNDIFVVDYSTTFKTLQISSAMQTKNVRFGLYIPPDKTFNNTRVTFQLEKSSTVTTYETYIATETEITIPSGEFAAKINDTYKDQIRIAYNEDDGEYHAYLDKKIGKIVLNGSEESLTYDSNYSRLQMPFNLQTKDWGLLGLTISDYFIIGDTETVNGSFNITRTNIYFKNNDLTSLNSWKTWLSTHNTTVYYVLEIPTTIDLGVIEMPTTYYPVTNIFTDSELQPLLEVNYYRDFKKTISTMQNAITTLQNSMVSLTEAEYDALPTKDDNVYYFIEEDSASLLTSNLNLNRSILEQPRTLTLDNSENLVDEEQPIDDAEFVEEREL